MRLSYLMIWKLKNWFQAELLGWNRLKNMERNEKIKKHADILFNEGEYL